MARRLISAGCASDGLRRTAPKPPIIQLLGRAIILGETMGETERLYICQPWIMVAIG